MASCDLCGLALPDSPFVPEKGTGRYCCRGCLNVAEELDLAETPGPRQPEPDPGSAVPEDRETLYLGVEGMHCTACEVFLEHKATALEGVSDASANYGVDLLQVQYDPDRIQPDEVARGVEGIGYRTREPDEAPSETTTRTTLGRLLVGGFFGMMTMVWYILFLYPVYLGVDRPLMDLGGPAGSYLFWNLAVMATVVLLYTGSPILRGAYVSLMSGRPNMDFLVALASTTAYVYSVLVLFQGGREVYFDITVVILFVVTAGHYYRDQITASARELVGEWTRAREGTVRRRTSEGTEDVEINELNPGDCILVRPGEQVPVDGVVEEGRASVDESLMTGEIEPRSRGVGDTVMGGSTVLDRPLVLQVEEPQSMMNRIVSTLWSIQSHRGGLEQAADRLAGVFVPLVLIAAAGASMVNWIQGNPPGEILLTGLAVLVVSCPCALGLATPLAVASGLRRALREGIVIQDGSVFEAVASPGIVAFDKTGTLTQGSLEVLEKPPGDVRRRAARLEQYSRHPVARCIVGQEESVAGSAAEVTEEPGRGISGRVDGEPTRVGNKPFLNEGSWDVQPEHHQQYESARRQGNLPVIVGWGGRSRGVYVLGDRPRDYRDEVLDELDERGYRVRILTGDPGELADDLTGHPAVDQVHRGITPQQKQVYLAEWKRENPVTMVGDGVNDAPALARGDLGVALAEGTTTASQAAGAVITDGDLRHLLDLFDIRSTTRRILRQNLGWAFLYNAIAVPAAFLGYLNPLVAALAMSLSSLIVVLNSRRVAAG